MLDIWGELPVKRNMWGWMECFQDVLQKSQSVLGADFIVESMHFPITGPLHPPRLSDLEMAPKPWCSSEKLVIAVVVQSLSYVWLFMTPGLQHARLPYPSLSPGVCSDSWPLSWWCHPAMSFSVTPFSSCPQSFLASGSSHQVAKVLELKLQHQFFQWIF